MCGVSRLTHYGFWAVHSNYALQEPHHSLIIIPSPAYVKMSSKQADDIARLTELSRVHRIVFDADSSRVQFHKSHEKSIEAVCKLSNKKYASYADVPGLDDSNPWKATAKSLAEMLTEKVDRCRQRNESSWRFACEPLVFARLSGDVVW